IRVPIVLELSVATGAPRPPVRRRPAQSALTRATRRLYRHVNRRESEHGPKPDRRIADLVPLHTNAAQGGRSGLHNSPRTPYTGRSSRSFLTTSITRAAAYSISSSVVYRPKPKRTADCSSSRGVPIASRTWLPAGP